MLCHYRTIANCQASSSPDRRLKSPRSRIRIRSQCNISAPFVESAADTCVCVRCCGALTFLSPSPRPRTCSPPGSREPSRSLSHSPNPDAHLSLRLVCNMAGSDEINGDSLLDNSTKTNQRRRPETRTLSGPGRPDGALHNNHKNSLRGRRLLAPTCSLTDDDLN
ncbi:hypothetical protein MTP99_011366 [Tenebrio molitor]|jgi:hypothetical protein|nr:hypothetical protein MTP99_011366 [Tenebrio molitor]